MTELRTYIVLAAFPVIIIFAVDWCGPSAHWVRKNHSRVLPAGIKRIQERRGRALLLLKYAVVLIAVRGLARGWHLVSIATHTQPSLVLIAAGIVGGSLIFGFRRALALLSQQVAVSESNDYVLRGSFRLWLLIFVVGGFVEEFWRALCISSFQQNGYSAIWADLLAAVAFSIAHLSGLPARIPGRLEMAAAETATGLLFGALFIWSGNLVPPCIASVIYYASNSCWLRRRYSSSASYA